MFSVVSKSFEKDTVVLAEEATANCLYFIEEGILEIYTSFENNEFILETLYPGSVVNHRAFFMSDQMYLNIRCSKLTKLLELSQTTMGEIRERWTQKKWSNDILFYQNRILK